MEVLDWSRESDTAIGYVAGNELHGGVEIHYADRRSFPPTASYILKIKVDGHRCARFSFEYPAKADSLFSASNRKKLRTPTSCTAKDRTQCFDYRRFNYVGLKEYVILLIRRSAEICLTLASQESLKLAKAGKEFTLIEVEYRRIKGNELVDEEDPFMKFQFCWASRGALIRHFSFLQMLALLTFYNLAYLERKNIIPSELFSQVLTALEADSKRRVPAATSLSSGNVPSLPVNQPAEPSSSGSSSTTTIKGLAKKRRSSATSSVPQQVTRPSPSSLSPRNSIVASLKPRSSINTSAQSGSRPSRSAKGTTDSGSRSQSKEAASTPVKPSNSPTPAQITTPASEDLLDGVTRVSLPIDFRKNPVCPPKAPLVFNNQTVSSSETIADAPSSSPLDRRELPSSSCHRSETQTSHVVSEPSFANTQDSQTQAVTKSAISAQPLLAQTASVPFHNGANSNPIDASSSPHASTSQQISTVEAPEDVLKPGEGLNLRRLSSLSPTPTLCSSNSSSALAQESEESDSEDPLDSLKLEIESLERQEKIASLKRKMKEIEAERKRKMKNEEGQGSAKRTKREGAYTREEKGKGKAKSELW